MPDVGHEKRWLVIVFRGFKYHKIVEKLDLNRGRVYYKNGQLSQPSYERAVLQPVLNK